MTNQIQVEHFTAALFSLLDETFDNVQGYYLDRGTSIFETLATISAEEASVPVGGKCATLAAQVKHVAFYLDVLENAVRTNTNERVDWDEIWRTTGAVTPDEWKAIKVGLRESYDRINDNPFLTHRICKSAASGKVTTLRPASTLISAAPPL